MSELKILIESEDETVALEQTDFLNEHLKTLPQIHKITQPRKPLDKNHAGGLLESILDVSLNSSAIVTLVGAIHIWLKNRANVLKAERKEITIKVKTISGEAEITANNFDEPEKIVEKILKTI